MRACNLRSLLTLTVLLFAGAVGTVQPAFACTGGACVMAGPRLASFSSERGVVTNAVVNGLLGSNVNLSVTDWEALGSGDINLVSYLNALQAHVGVSDTSTALGFESRIAQLITPAITVAQADGNTAAVTALTKLLLPGLTETIQLGELLKVTFPVGALTTSKINLLDLVTGVIQLYNYESVLITPAPIALTGVQTNVAQIAGVSIWLRVIEPPIYVCGPTGTAFHTAAIRIKLNLDLVNLLPNSSGLNILGIVGAQVTIGDIDLYLEVARATGTIGTINAITGALSLTATPGVTQLYLGSISDAFFWNRTRQLTSADVQLGIIGKFALTVGTFPLQVNLNLDLRAKSFATSSTPTSAPLLFTGPYPQKQTRSMGTSFVTTLTDTLMTNLTVQVSDPLIDALLGGLLPVLKGVVVGALPAVINPILFNLADPLLDAIGVRIGEVDVIVDGVGDVCTIGGYAYSDANHSSTRDGNEAGTALTLYAKLIASTAPTVVAKVVAIDGTTAAYSFADVINASYTVIIDTNNTLNDVTPGVTSGWVGTQAPTHIRAVTIAHADLMQENFGLYNGSRLSGTVFIDTGAGAGIANNAIKDGTETGLANVTVRVTDNAASTTFDTTVTVGDGTYTLYVPAAAGANPVKVTEVAPAAYLSTGGSAGTTSGTYARATDTVTFTHAGGSTYTGVNFADVPENTFAPDHRRTALPGAVVFYPHSLVAGSGGQLTFSMTQAVTPAIDGWLPVIYRDTNCNSTIDAGEAVISGAITVTAGQTICVVARTTVPTNAPYGAQHQNTLSASFSYTNASPTLNASQQRVELTIVADDAAAALKLTKVVDKATALPGTVLLYTITYTNNGAEPLSTLKINDATPAYTKFTSAACGALPAGLSACSVTSQPTVGTAGNVAWTFTGTLAPGASGSVLLTVTLE